jgi:hypothetical protein
LLPFYLRSLNKQNAKFKDADRIKQVDARPHAIARPRKGPHKRTTRG